MKPEEVESLMGRGKPAAPPPEIRQRLLARVAERDTTPTLGTSGSRTHLLGVLTVAASILCLASTIFWLLKTSPPPAAPHGDGRDTGQPFEERRIADVADDDKISAFTWSRDGKHWACIAQTTRPGSQGQYVIVDGKKEPEHPYGNAQPPRFGNDGHYMYLASPPGNFDYALILDGVPQKEFVSYSAASWSPDGKKLAYVGRTQNHTYVVLEGKRSDPYDEVLSLLWSPEGGSLAYVARINREHFVVLGAEKGEPFDEISFLTFSPDGKTLAYRGKEGSYVMVVGGKKTRGYDGVDAPTFGPGGMIAFGVRRNIPGQQKQSWVVAGRWPDLKDQEPEFAFEAVGKPVFSSDGKRWAYAARADGKESIVVESIDPKGLDVGEAFDSVSQPILGSDPASLVYVAGKGFQKYLAVGGKLTRKFSLIDRISLQPDGTAVAYRAGHYGKQLVVAGNTESQEIDEVLSGPVWSADGKRVAYSARLGGVLWSKVLEVK